MRIKLEIKIKSSILTASFELKRKALAPEQPKRPSEREPNQKTNIVIIDQK